MNFDKLKESYLLLKEKFEDGEPMSDSEKQAMWDYYEKLDKSTFIAIPSKRKRAISSSMASRQRRNKKKKENAIHYMLALFVIGVLAFTIYAFVDSWGFWKVLGICTVLVLTTKWVNR